jgi:predicted DNA-binding protein with PD1-like motif
MEGDMKISSGLKTAEVFFVRVEEDEDFLQSLEEVAKSKGFENAVVLSATGSLKKAVLVNPISLSKPPEVGRKEWEGPLEIVSLVGAIGKNHAHQGRMSHIHICLARHDGPAIGGVLGFGSLAYYPIEVSLLSYQGHFDL